MKQPSAMGLVQATKNVWCTNISEAYCQSLIYSMPNRIAAEIKKTKKAQQNNEFNFYFSIKTFVSQFYYF